MLSLPALGLLVTSLVSTPPSLERQYTVMVPEFHIGRTCEFWLDGVQRGSVGDLQDSRVRVYYHRLSGEIYRLEGTTRNGSLP